MERIQKVIAAAGLSSRRGAERLLVEGRVMVNGRVVNELGVKVDPSRDHIRVDGKRIQSAQPKTYLMFHKPKDCMSTLNDPEGRKTVKDFLHTTKLRLYPVGRLDYNSEGLLLLTNDGDVASRLLHPRSRVPRTYVVKVSGALTDSQIERLQNGILLDDGITGRCRIKKLRKLQANSWLEVTLYEGRKREVRRMMEAVGCPVIRLKRIAFGPLRLGELPSGRSRPLSPEEIAHLRDLLERIAKSSTREAR